MFLSNLMCNQSWNEFFKDARYDRLVIQKRRQALKRSSYFS